MSNRLSFYLHTHTYTHIRNNCFSLHRLVAWENSQKKEAKKTVFNCFHVTAESNHRLRYKLKIADGWLLQHNVTWIRVRQVSDSSQFRESKIKKKIIFFLFWNCWVFSQKTIIWRQLKLKLRLTFRLPIHT